MNHPFIFPGVGSWNPIIYSKLFFHPKGGCLGFLNQPTASFFLFLCVGLFGWWKKHSAKIGIFPGKKKVSIELGSMMEYDGKWLDVGFVFNRNVWSSLKHMENDGTHMENDPGVKEMPLWVGELFSVEPWLKKGQQQTDLYNNPFHLESRLLANECCFFQEDVVQHLRSIFGKVLLMVQKSC